MVRLRFKDGKPTGEYEDFLTGFVISNEKAWGRPVGIAVGQDGVLFVTEDGSGTIWRVSYRKAGTTAETAPSKELATEGRLPRNGEFRVAQQATAHDDQPPLPERNPVHAGASARKRLHLRARFRPYPGVTPRSPRPKRSALRRCPRSSSTTSRSPLSSKDCAERPRRSC